MPKDFFVSVRVILAFGVAAVADALQFGVGWFTSHVMLLPGELADFVLDIVVAAILSLLLGFHPILLPCFILKAVQIPVIEELPTWTACVAYLVWSKKRKAANHAGTMDAPDGDTSQPVEDSPQSATLSVATSPERSKNSGGLYLIATVALLVGLLWWQHARNKSEPGQQSGETSTFAAAPFQYTGTNQVVVVAPIETASSASPSAKKWQANDRLEGIRTSVEEMLSGIDGIKLLERQQEEAFLSQWQQNPGGQTAAHPIVVVIATILDMQQTAANFTGYGIAEKSLDIECSLRVQVVNATDHSIAFSKTLSGSKTQEQSAAIQSSSTEDFGSEAIKSALHKLEHDADFRSALESKKPTP